MCFSICLQMVDMVNKISVFWVKGTDVFNEQIPQSENSQPFQFNSGWWYITHRIQSLLQVVLEWVLGT